MFATVLASITTRGSYGKRITIDEELGKEINEMCSYSEAVFKDGLEQGREQGFESGRKCEREEWLKLSVEKLNALKRDGKLSEFIWDVVAGTCPDKSLLPELRKAVGVSFPSFDKPHS